jgi:Cdc6-like AAA superfamily ATPase
MIINKYDPRLKKKDELSRTFVCGEMILEELLTELHPRKNKKLSNQSWIIIGSRGVGKSHLLALLYHRIKDDERLSSHWHPLIFPEELFDVDSLYRLLLKIFEAIFKTNGTAKNWNNINREYLTLKKTKINGNLKQKRQTRQDISKKLLEFLVQINQETGKKFIFILENLQHLFREQLPEEDLKLLRSFMSEHPGVFIILGTALTVFNVIENYGKPSYHFFRIRSMESLDQRGIIDFLTKTAAFRNDKGIEEKIGDNRHYINI